MLKHYVNFDTPGAFMPESEVREVKTRIPANLKRIPEGTYALDYFDKEIITKNKEMLSGKVKNQSTRIVFGKIFTLKDLIKEGFNENTPLYHNAESSEGKVIKCIMGNWQPYDKKWIILNNYDDLKSLTNPI